MESRVRTDSLDYKVPKDRQENVVCVEKLEREVHQEHPEILDTTDSQVLQEWQDQPDDEEQLGHQDLGVEEWCTQDGEKAPVQVLQEQNWCMQAELEELNMIIVVAEQTNSACHLIPSTVITGQECRGIVTCMELSTNNL